MKLEDANGFIIEQDFDDKDTIITHTDDPGKAMSAFVALVKNFLDITPTFTVRMYAVNFESEDRDTETLKIGSKNYEHCKAVQIGAFIQTEHKILVDLNAFIGPVVRYGHDGDDQPHTHSEE